jgi:hypothetical protein
MIGFDLFAGILIARAILAVIVGLFQTSWPGV